MNTVDICTRAIKVFEDVGRGEDFLSVLRASANGTLVPQNIAVHLLLDIGHMLSQESLQNIRYNSTTLDFWTLVYKMFRGKATRFFRGTMSLNTDEFEGDTCTLKCINF